MPITTLPAYFDGNRICLDESFNMKPNTKLIVTILPRQNLDNEHEDWLFLSGQKLEDAYGENEPNYSTDLLKEVNLNYETR